MKQTLAALAGFFVLLFVYTKLAGPIPFTVTSYTTQKTDAFSVTGEGKVSAPPDVAVVNVGVQTQGATVKIAQDALNTKINQVSSAVKGLGINAADLQTGSYNIQPTYDFGGGTQRITGYQASTNLTIKVREIDQANGVIDAATAAGANQVGGISFEIDDPTKLQNEAREKAVADAKAKAADAARIAGFKLGRVINYAENFGGSTPRPYLMAAKDEAVTSGVPTNVEPGSNEIVVHATLSFEIN